MGTHFSVLSACISNVHFAGIAGERANEQALIQAQTNPLIILNDECGRGQARSTVILFNVCARLSLHKCVCVCVCCLPPPVAHTYTTQPSPSTPPPKCKVVIARYIFGLCPSKNTSTIPWPYLARDGQQTTIYIFFPLFHISTNFSYVSTTTSRVVASWAAAATATAAAVDV